MPFGCVRERCRRVPGRETPAGPCIGAVCSCTAGVWHQPEGVGVPGYRGVTDEGAIPPHKNVYTP
jgi:hypothetical protein